MLRFEERDDVTVQNPPAGEVVLFYTDGAFRIKDSAGEVTTITTVEGLEEVAEATEPKVYVATLSQTGTDAPIAVVGRNTLGGTIVWTRDSAGVFEGTLSNAFTLDKTFIFQNLPTKQYADEAIITVVTNTTSTVRVNVFDETYTGVDSFDKLSIKIEVYP